MGLAAQPAADGSGGGGSCFSFSPLCAGLAALLQVALLALGGGGGALDAALGGGALLPPARRRALILALLCAALLLWVLGNCLTPLPPLSSSSSSNSSSSSSSSSSSNYSSSPSAALKLSVSLSSAEEMLGQEGAAVRAWMQWKGVVGGHSEAFSEARRALANAGFMERFQPVARLPWVAGAVRAARWAQHCATGILYAAEGLGASTLGLLAWGVAVWRGVRRGGAAAAAATV